MRSQGMGFSSVALLFCCLGVCDPGPSPAARAAGVGGVHTDRQTQHKIQGLSRLWVVSYSLGFVCLTVAGTKGPAWGLCALLLRAHTGHFLTCLA